MTYHGYINKIIVQHKKMDLPACRPIVVTMIYSLWNYLLFYLSDIGNIITIPKQCGSQTLRVIDVSQIANVIQTCINSSILHRARSHFDPATDVQ